MAQTHSAGGFFLHVMPAILYIGAVFYAGSVGNAPMPETQFMPGDKLMHLAGFGLMQLVLFRAVRYELNELSLVRQLLISAVMASGLGAALEFYQAAFPNREPELLDWVADTVGAALAAGLIYAGHAIGDRARSRRVGVAGHVDSD